MFTTLNLISICKVFTIDYCRIIGQSVNIRKESSIYYLKKFNFIQLESVI